MTYRFSTDTNTNEIPVARKEKMISQTSSLRDPRKEFVLDDFREPPGSSPNTTFNEAILNIWEKIFYITSAGLPAAHPALL